MLIINGASYVGKADFGIKLGRYPQLRFWVFEKLAGAHSFRPFSITF